MHNEPTEPELSLTEQSYLNEIDERIKRAAALIEGVDLYDEAEGDEELLENLWVERNHCGTCTVRTVMEEVWPAVDAYVEWLKTPRESIGE